jgi:polysaccharide export outer membrane protein
MADRFDLNAHDVVYVDASDLATWNRLFGLIWPSVNATYGGINATRYVTLMARGK